MQANYMEIFNEIFYDVEQDEEMNVALKDGCDLIGSIIVKYGEILNEIRYRESDDDGFVDTVIILFIRKIMEHLDAINILVEKSSFTQAKIILRTLLESVISLRFILNEDTEKRAAAYYLYRHYEEIERMKCFDENTKDGKMYKKLMGEEKFHEVAEKCKKKKQVFERMVQSKNVFVEIEKLRKSKIKQKKKEFPKKKPYVSWFEVCSNVNSVKGMMKVLGWEKYYEALYGGMSLEVHAYNATTEIISDEEGLHLKTLRNPLGGYGIIELTGNIALKALMDVYVYLKDGEVEKEEFRAYYKEYRQRINGLKVKFQNLLGTGEV